MSDTHTTRRGFLKTLGRGAAVVAWGRGRLRAGESKGAGKPNIVFILADDLGYGDPGCQNPASKIPTPHLDRLAREGRRFTDAHTPSSEGRPTRYGLLTGRYPWRTKVNHGSQRCWHGPVIESDRLTIGTLLQRQGYDTACIGKWHLGAE